MPEARSRFRMPNSRSASPADSVEVGSSRISTDDFAATARAMAISWRSAGRKFGEVAVERQVEVERRGDFGRPPADGARRQEDRRGAGAQVRRGSGSRRPSGPARRPGWSAGGRSRCRARGPLAATGSITALPATSTCPASACNVPDRIFTSVDLPAPLAPISATISPRATTRSAPSSARVAAKLLSMP